MTTESTPICLHPHNPRYLLYKGRPLVLVTATEHYGAVLNRNFDYLRYLEDAQDKRQTLSRCFLLFRELEHTPLNPHSPCKPLAGEYLAPFARSGPGYATDGYPKFDLDRWDAEFFARLHGFIQEAARRDVIVELTLFSNTYNDLIWRLNPFCDANNINGVGQIAPEDYTSMRNAALFERQKTYVRKIVHEVNAYDNIYFEICNEPFGNLPEHASADEVTAWVRALAQVVRDEESKLPKRHLIIQDVIRRLRGASPLESIFEEPLLDGANCHSGELLSYGGTLVPVLAAFMRRELNLAAIIALWNASSAASKPFVFDEDNSCSNGLDAESWTVHRKRAWATVCSGGHYDMIDFSIQVGGQETGTPAAQAHIRTWMKHLSAFIHSVDFVHTAPARDFCTQVPPHTIAATLVNPGVEVVIYLADRREVGEPGLGQACTGPLAFSLPAGSYQARLYDPVEDRYTGEPWDLSGGEVTLTVPPFVHDVVLHIQVVQRSR